MKCTVTLLVSLALSSPCFATVQANDILKYGGEDFRTPVFPLEQYRPVAEEKIRLEIEPNAISTGNYRGYVATWEVQSNKLYLVAIDGWIAESFDSHKRATLDLLFPGRVQNSRVFADWFSGQIFTPGRRWGPSLPKDDQEQQESEAELIITVDEGNVIKVEDKRTFNQVPEDTARKLADPQH